MPRGSIGIVTRRAACCVAASGAAWHSQPALRSGGAAAVCGPCADAAKGLALQRCSCCPLHGPACAGCCPRVCLPPGHEPRRHARAPRPEAGFCREGQNPGHQRRRPPHLALVQGSTAWQVAAGRKAARVRRTRCGCAAWYQLRARPAVEPACLVSRHRCCAEFKNATLAVSTGTQLVSAIVPGAVANTICPPAAASERRMCSAAAGDARGCPAAGLHSKQADLAASCWRHA